MQTHQREPNGRLSRLGKEPDTSPGEVKRLRDAALSGMRAQEWGTELGHLFLRGKISAEQFEAGKRWHDLASDYERVVTGGKLAIKGFSLQGEGGHPPDPDSEAGQRSARKAQAILTAMDEARGALKSAGLPAISSVEWTCAKDRSPIGHVGLLALIKGLEALSLHWTLTAPRKRASKSDR